MADIRILFTFSHNSIEISNDHSIIFAFGLRDLLIPHMATASSSLCSVVGIYTWMIMMHMSTVVINSLSVIFTPDIFHAVNCCFVSWQGF